MLVTSDVIPEEELERLVERGDAVYEERIRPVLEPEQNGQWVAIHLDSGDYALGPTSPAALRALRARQPEGKVMTRIVGPDREDPTLQRMIAGHFLSQQRK